MCVVSYSYKLVSRSGDEHPAVGGDAGGQDAVVMLQVEKSVHRVSIDVKEAESCIAACRGETDQLTRVKGRKQTSPQQ